MKRNVVLYIFCCYLIFFNVCSKAPQSAREIINRSVEKHGGKALTNWKTMVVKGEVFQEDVGRKYRGEYIKYAQKPDKLRVERDLTKFERGRLFYSYIYNNGKGWMLINLIPYYGKQYGKLFKRWLNQCNGIAYYANSADTLILKPDKKVKGEKAYVISAITDNDTTNLYINKKDYYLIQEEYGKTKRIYSGFKRFGNAIYPTYIDEITKIGPRTVKVNFIYHSIEYNTPIDQKLFEEDMPNSNISENRKE